jgi:hypothetical protein
LLGKMDTPAPKTGVDFALGIDCKTDDGGRASFYTSDVLTHFTPITVPGKQTDPQMIKISTGEKYTVYNAKAAKLLYGGDQPVTQSNVLMTLPLKGEGNNQFARLSVSELYLMDIFKGIPAPYGQMYLALNTSLKFEKADKSAPQIGYCVPSIFNHFYISLNGGRMMPASKATWLAEQPFANPGEPDVTVSDKDPRSGVLVFLVDMYDNYQFKQLSLHFYDTSYGHIELPLLGRLTKQMLTMDAMPKEAPATETTEATRLHTPPCPI